MCIYECALHWRLEREVLERYPEYGSLEQAPSAKAPQAAGRRSTKIWLGKVWLCLLPSNNTVTSLRYHYANLLFSMADNELPRLVHFFSTAQ